MDNGVLHLTGELTKDTVPVIESALMTDHEAGLATGVDLAEVTRIDSSGVALLDEILSRARIHQPDVDLRGASAEIANAIATFSSLKLPPAELREEPGFLETLGDRFLESRDAFVDGLFLTADILWWSFVGFFNRKGIRKGAFITQSLLIGMNAVPIISLLSLILGVILALQAAAQLRQFGANIFVANLMSVTMIREMGPMMTAIIVAGRSGSAIASEIATMKVSEELDALKMMAINPIRYVIVPKFHAITICMPLLVVISMLIGIAGGLIVAVSYLDLTAVSYINACINSIDIPDILISLLKSVFFAWVIVIIGSYYGFNVEGGAEGVGKVTTASVVASIFAVIVFDAIFSLAYMI